MKTAVEARLNTEERQQILKEERQLANLNMVAAQIEAAIKRGEDFVEYNFTDDTPKVPQEAGYYI